MDLGLAAGDDGKSIDLGRGIGVRVFENDVEGLAAVEVDTAGAAAGRGDQAEGRY